MRSARRVDKLLRAGRRAFTARAHTQSLVVYESDAYIVIDKPFDMRVRMRGRRHSVFGRDGRGVAAQIDGEDPELLITLDKLLARHRPSLPQPVCCVVCESVRV